MSLECQLYPVGSSIILQNQRINKVNFIYKGTVRVCKRFVPYFGDDEQSFLIVQLPEGSFFGETINKSISEDSDSFHNSDEVQTFDSKELEELKLKKNVLNDSIFKTKRFLTPIERKYQKEKKMQRQ